MLRGNNRRRLFARAGDYLTFIALMRRALTLTGCRLHAVALLSNHVHLLITPAKEVALPRFVKYVAQRYAQIRNHRRGATGKLFEQRYLCVVVREPMQLAIATAYVDLNGRRAGLAPKGTYYRWSTHALHAGQVGAARIPPRIWTPGEWYQALVIPPL